MMLTMQVLHLKIVWITHHSYQGYLLYNHVVLQVERTPLAAHLSSLRETRPRHWPCLDWVLWEETAMVFSPSGEKYSTLGRPHTNRLGNNNNKKTVYIFLLCFRLQNNK